MSDTTPMTLQTLKDDIVFAIQHDDTVHEDELGMWCDVLNQSIAREAALMAEVAELRGVLEQWRDARVNWASSAMDWYTKLHAETTAALAPAAPRVDDGGEVTP